MILQHHTTSLIHTLVTALRAIHNPPCPRRPALLLSIPTGLPKAPWTLPALGLKPRRGSLWPTNLDRNSPWEALPRPCARTLGLSLSSSNASDVFFGWTSAHKLDMRSLCPTWPAQLLPACSLNVTSSKAFPDHLPLPTPAGGLRGPPGVRSLRCPSATQLTERKQVWWLMRAGAPESDTSRGGSGSSAVRSSMAWES